MGSSNYNKNYGWNDWQWDYDWEPPNDKIELDDSKCKHEWKEDKWFTSRVYVTCKKCGARQEDEQ